jgi:2,4-dienoyl-CoA reductase-like NADH-dependent reductase (Old Yellow Enzyme family)
MSKLFEITKLNGMTIKNRFVRSATWEGMAKDDGTCTPKLVELMAKLAEGGVGLIITSYAYVSERGKAIPWQLGIYKDQLIPALSEMTEAVHRTDAKVVIQIAHAGLYADPNVTGKPPLAPSAVTGFTESSPQEMTTKDIQDVVEAFGLAAKRAVKAGFDGVQIHAAHGYLLSQFLSPAFNQRNDLYGGPIENRARILLEVLHSIRKNIGMDYPVMIKMNCQDFLDNGLELKDSLTTGSMLKDGEIDAIELSGGTLASGKLNPSRTKIFSETDEAYFKDAAIEFKKNVDIPLILVGGIRSFHVAEQLVKDGIADYVSMCRPFIREPALINRWESGNHAKSTCLSDLKCFGPALSGEGIYCVVEKGLQDKKLQDKNN